MRQVWSLRDEHPMVQEMTRTRQPLAIRVATDHVMRPEVRNYLSAKRISAALVVPIFMQDRMVGILTARRDIDHDFDADDMRVAQALAHQASLAIELTRLAERGRLAAVAEERTRLAREIHDSLAQAFTATIIQIEAARRATPAQLSLHLDRAAAAARVGLTEARQSVQWLRAESVADVDALPMLRSLISRVQLLSSTTIAATFDDAECILPIRQAEALVQVAQEALMNTWRHAPGSAASLRLRRDHRGVTLIVEDGGPGFDPAAAHDGFGIAIMRERLAAVRGVLEIASGRERGTTVIARLPLESRTVATGRST
jgi:signal transduction histidine kinase